MRIRVAFGLLSLMALTAPAFTAPEPIPSFVGEWIATAHVPGGDGSETLKVVKTGDGYAITAKLVGAAAGQGLPEAGPGEEIVLDGDHFSYKRTLTLPGGKLVITYTGVVSADTFNGTVEMGTLGKVPYTGVRVTDSGRVP